MSDIYAAASDQIRKQHHLHKGSLFSDYHHTEHTCYCSFGALLVVSGVLDTGYAGLKTLKQCQQNKILYAELVKAHVCGVPLTSWNDRPERTQEEVADKLLELAQELREVGE